VTNIYEGTSQLQIVAAMSKLLGHALDDLLDEWAALDYGSELAPLKIQLKEATEMFKRATDHLKEHDRDVIDYFAADLTDMGVYVINCWLMLQDARQSDRKRDMARIYIADHLPKIHRAGETIQTADMTPLQARESILTGPF
jgi:hypothetical protein